MESIVIAMKDVLARSVRRRRWMVTCQWRRPVRVANHLTRGNAAIGAGTRFAFGIKEEHLHIITRNFSGTFEAGRDGAARPVATFTKHTTTSLLLLVSVDAQPARCALVALRSVGGMEGCVLPS
jgi:hypothetical protein